MSHTPTWRYDLPAVERATSARTADVQEWAAPASFIDDTIAVVIDDAVADLGVR